MIKTDPEELEAFVVDVFSSLDTERSAAEAVAASLVASDLRGHGTHGVMRVPNYVERARDGDIDPTARPEVRERSSSSVLIEGNCAFGQCVSDRPR